MSIFTKPPMFTRTTAPKLKTPRISFEFESRIDYKRMVGWINELIADGFVATGDMTGEPDFQKTRVELERGI